MHQSWSLENLPNADRNQKQSVRVIITNLDDKSKIFTIPTSIKGVDLFNLAGIESAYYKEFRLTIGSREIYPTN